MLRKYRPLIIIFIIIVLLITGLTTFLNSRYRIVSVTPDNTNYPSSLGQMDVYFNRTLDKQGLNIRIKEDLASVVEVNFKSTVRIKVFDDHLRLTYGQTPLEGDYEVTLKDIRSIKGETLTKTLPLNVRDIEYDELTEEEKKLYDQAAAGSDGNSAEFPLLDKLPYETEKYQISFRYEDTDPAPTIIITMKFFEPGSVAVPATPAEQQAYQNEIRTYRKEALDWLAAQDKDYLTAYSMEYTEVDLQQEFPTGRGRYQTESTEVETDSGQ